jgi:aminopeptidase-like protein
VAAPVPRRTRHRAQRFSGGGNDHADFALTAPRELLRDLDVDQVGAELYALVERLYPICRSITGDGVRTTLRILQETVPLEIVEVPTGTKAFDWVVPQEWNIRDAYVEDASGRRVVDFQQHNLHVVNYSVPVDETFTLEDLRPHLHSLPEQPDLIPYRTSYYAPTWGFCLRHNDLKALPDGDYRVRIDSSLEDGHLTYGECVVAGDSPDEVLVSAHVCHPSLANDNLSGVAVASLLATRLNGMRLRHTYRFVFAPGTIGALTWLARNPDAAMRIKHGLVLTCVGDAGGCTYKRSRRGSAEVDRGIENVLRHARADSTVVDFSPYGYDERQYCSPGFNLPVGCLMRTPWGQFPEYHTSADNLELVRPEALADSFATILAAFTALEENRRYLNTSPFGEPQLGRRGLYRLMGGDATESVDELGVLRVLNLSDGRHDLLDVAAHADLPFAEVSRAAQALLDAELLREAGPGETIDPPLMPPAAP